MRILLVEDDDRIAKPLAEDLRHQHHVVDLAYDGIEGWNYSQGITYDLILLDLMLPKLNGITLCQKLRASKYTGFVLMLTARDTTSDKVIGLDAGADDYLIKPFELEELSARIRALARRPSELQPPIDRYGKLEINSALHIATYAETSLHLTPKEYLILECFIRNPEIVFTRSMLLDKLWELDRVSGENTIKTHITNLRHKLKTAGSKEVMIETVYGVGYRILARY